MKFRRWDIEEEATSSAVKFHSWLEIYLQKSFICNLVHIYLSPGFHLRSLFGRTIPSSIRRKNGRQIIFFHAILKNMILVLSFTQNRCLHLVVGSKSNNIFESLVIWHSRVRHSQLCRSTLHVIKQHRKAYTKPSGEDLCAWFQATSSKCLSSHARAVCTSSLTPPLVLPLECSNGHSVRQNDE